MDFNSLIRCLFSIQNKMRRLILRLHILCILAFALILSGCSHRPMNEPPRIRYGKELCRQCQMVISDERFAAAFSDQESEFFKFDDIGCMRLYQEKNKVIPKYAWVHDYENQAWMEVSKSVFVRSIQIMTPMGSGVIAFSNRLNAEQFANKQGGQIVAWDEVPNFFQNNIDLIKGETNEAN